MKRVLVLASIIGIMPPLAAVATSAPAAGPEQIKVGASCPGGNRWAVKTLTDASAGSVDYRRPVKATVASLAAQAPSTTITATTKRLPSEKTVYEVTAKLIKAKLSYEPDTKKGDEDITLVIADPTTGAMMIAELPKARCSPESRSIKAAQMDKARSAFVAACGTPPAGHFETLHGIARITGVGFFDLDHGKAQTGRAPHFRELHPLLAFSTTHC